MHRNATAVYMDFCHILMLSNSLLQQHNVNRLTCHITMKVVSEDSSCSMVWWGARAACAEVSIGQWNPRKLSMAWGAIWHLRCHMAPDTYGRILSIYYTSPPTTSCTWVVSDYNMDHLSVLKRFKMPILFKAFNWTIIHSLVDIKAERYLLSVD
jgi:hypothetical protein